MELYKELAALRCFTREDMVRLAGSDNAAHWQIRSYLDKGYIEHIRRDFYAVISLETEQPIPNRFQIASRAADDACVSHHSAFEYYGYANQVFYTVYATTQKHVRPFSYDGVDYRFVASKGSAGVVDSEDGVRVTSIERTVIDCIADFDKCGGLEELLRCLTLVPSLSADKLFVVLEQYGHGKLYQKAGYILEAFKDDLALPDSFFSVCEDRISDSKVYLTAEHEDFMLQKKWKLYAPDDLKVLVNKGVNDYGAI